MAVLEKIKEFFIPRDFASEVIISAPPMTYTIHPLTDKHLKEVLKLNLRCFKSGENYTKYTFAYLLEQPHSLSYRIVNPKGNMVGFIFLAVNKDGTGHITTIGIAPEHRRRGLGDRLLHHAEKALKERRISTMTLEVRVSNVTAQELYHQAGFSIVQKMDEYYNNGEDCFLMVKPIF